MKSEVKVKTKRFIDCPHCGEEDMCIEHLFDFQSGQEERMAGPWHCRHCGHSFFIYVRSDGTARIEEREEVSYPIFILLEIPPQEQSIFLKVASDSYGRPVEDDDQRYFYEEHTCPVNYFRSVKEIKVGDDDDPHGLALYRGWFVAESKEDQHKARWLKDNGNEKQHEQLPEKTEGGTDENR